MLTREQILGASDLKTATVDVQEWGGIVSVRMLTSAERDSIAAILSDKSDDAVSRFRHRLIVATMVDDSGARIFFDGEEQLLSGKSAAAIERVFTASARLNGLAAGAVEDAEGNSGAGLSAGSSSASPSASDAASESSATESTPQS
jgi:hypothetical protein